MGCWFLPPDFTFTPEGPLQLGSIIEHPSRPTSVVTSPRFYDVPLPEVETLIEKNHSHSDEVSKSGGIGLLASFVGLASGSVNYEGNRRNLVQYGNVDHEIRCLVTPFSPDFLRGITSLDAVQEWMEDTLMPRIRKRPIYLVSGLRITNSSFTVTKEKGRGHQGDVSATGPAGPVPVEMGGNLSGGLETTKTDSYETAPGIVFAYRLHVIRTKKQGSGAKAQMFEHRSAVHSNREAGEPDTLEIVEADAEVLSSDLDEQIKYEEHDTGDGEFFAQPGKLA